MNNYQLNKKQVIHKEQNLMSNNGRNTIHSTLAEQIKLTFKQGVFHTMVSMDTKLRKSTLYGLPITYFKQKTRSAIQYSTIAQELNEYVSKKTVSTI